MRLIDADALIPLIKMREANDYDEFCQGNNAGIAFAVERIKQMPTIEPEIIRCKDCIFWNELFPKCNKVNKFGYGVNDYCSKAEKKGESDG